MKSNPTDHKCNVFMGSSDLNYGAICVYICRFILKCLTYMLVEYGNIGKTPNYMPLLSLIQLKLLQSTQVLLF